MKKCFLLFLLTSNLTVIAQTKKETIDWLNTKFATSPIIMNEIEQYNWFLKINPEGSFTIQSYNYSPKVLVPDLSNYRWKTLFSGHFKDLAPNSVRTETIDGKIFIFASCSSGRCITQQDQGPDYKTLTIPELALGIISNASLEDRCKKAFIHLITLCGGKKEPF